MTKEETIRGASLCMVRLRLDTMITGSRSLIVFVFALIDASSIRLVSSHVYNVKVVYVDVGGLYEWEQ